MLEVRQEPVNILCGVVRNDPGSLQIFVYVEARCSIILRAQELPFAHARLSGVRAGAAGLTPSAIRPEFPARRAGCGSASRASTNLSSSLCVSSGEADPGRAAALRACSGRLAGSVSHLKD
jgi:hypothetical protein